MATDHDASSAAAELAHHHETFVAAFNAGDLDALEGMYEDEGILIPTPGHPAAGPARTAALRYMIDRGVPLEARLRGSYVSGDIALLIVDWSFRGTARDGTPVDISGAATDVVRRGPGGQWRYVIDNPFGSVTSQ